jgi:NADH-quinone oxidoreductase subunit K
MIFININFFLKITTLVFVIALLGLVLNRKNILMAIVSIELLILSINLNFITFSIYLDDMLGQLFVLFILTIAAIETGIGLSILTAFNKLQNSIEFKFIKINNLKF